MLNEYTATITTDGSGDATVYLGSEIRGRILAIKYEPGTLDNGADLAFTGETSEQPVLTKANAGGSDVWYYPLAPANKMADGSASSLTEVELWLYKERLKLVVAQGGDTKEGTVTLWVDEPVIG